MSTQYNSSPTQEKAQAKSQTHKIEWIKALTPLEPFKSHFKADWFDARLIYSWLAYRGNLPSPQPSSINQMSKALLIGARAVSRITKVLVDAKLAEAAGTKWQAKEPPECWFRTFANEHGKCWYDTISYLKVNLPAPGQTIAGRRWSITHCVVWSLFLSLMKKNKINCFASQAAAMLGISVSTAKQCAVDFEKGGLIEREKEKGKRSHLTPLPLNGHHSLFVSKTPKPTESKHLKVERPIPPERRWKVDLMWRCETDYLTWEKELRRIQQNSANGIGSFPNYRDVSIEREYRIRCPILHRLDTQPAPKAEPKPVIINNIGWDTPSQQWTWATEEQITHVLNVIDYRLMR
jgi:hypothetical protein